MVGEWRQGFEKRKQRPWLHGLVGEKTNMEEAMRKKGKKKKRLGGESRVSLFFSGYLLSQAMCRVGRWIAEEWEIVRQEWIDVDDWLSHYMCAPKQVQLWRVSSCLSTAPYLRMAPWSLWSASCGQWAFVARHGDLNRGCEWLELKEGAYYPFPCAAPPSSSLLPFTNLPRVKYFGHQVSEHVYVNCSRWTIPECIVRCQNHSSQVVQRRIHC